VSGSIIRVKFSARAAAGVETDAEATVVGTLVKPAAIATATTNTRAVLAVLISLHPAGSESKLAAINLPPALVNNQRPDREHATSNYGEHFFWLFAARPRGVDPSGQ